MMLSTGKGAELGLCCRVRRPVTHNLLYCATGIPELKTHKDVAYLKETLFLDRSEEEALKAFKEEVRTWEWSLLSIMMLCILSDIPLFSFSRLPRRGRTLTLCV